MRSFSSDSFKPVHGFEGVQKRVIIHKLFDQKSLRILALFFVLPNSFESQSQAHEHLDDSDQDKNRWNLRRRLTDFLTDFFFTNVNIPTII